MAFRVLAFHTEGAPHDRGLDLRNEARLFRRLVEPFADEVVIYSPRRLRADGREALDSWADYTDYLRRHPRSKQLRRFKTQWARCGFNAWKPYVCKKMLERDDVHYGDIVFYHDINVSYYPAYRRSIDQWQSLANSILDALSCDLFVPAGVALKYDAKAFLVRKLLGNGRHLKHVVGLWNGLIIMRKSRRSIALIDDWWRLCKELDNISPLPNPRPYNEMIWHSVDQSVMGVAAEVWRRKALVPPHWPKFRFKDRTFSREFLRCSRQKSTLGEIVRSIRIKAGLSRSLFAKRTGIPLSRVQQIERGDTPAEKHELTSFKTVLGNASVLNALAQCDRERRQVVGQPERKAGR